LINLPDSTFGRSVRFAFNFISGSYNTASGWYIDLIEVQEGDFQFVNPNYFESNPWSRVPCFEGWYASNGVWEVGIPSSGPGSSLGGYSCVATVLSGSYPGNANSRLISPAIPLPAFPQDGALWLSFWHWFSMSDDYGVVEMSIDGGAWQEITRRFYNYGGGWTQYIVDLSDYPGQSVRFAYHFVSGGYNTSTGWYIDNMVITEGKKTFNNPEGFEGGTRGWWASHGVWQIGESANACSGDCCAGTRLAGNYPGNANTRLITPAITMPPSAMLRFVHRFSFDSGDQGYVEISVNEEAWSAISSVFTGYSGTCSPYIVDLSLYSGQPVRFAFHFTSDTYNNDGAGWFIDEFEIVGASEEMPETPTFTSIDYTPAA
ncbi:MAG: choice-of-anchor J domain-containing protein, partial [Methanosarcinaceae archaeon]|nr:choice-of-anchor J domain-containing protein [Methanosarcinaceae archaeon]